MIPGMQQSQLEVRWPWIVLAVLLGVCLAHGLWVVRDLGPYSAILDTYRDAGFVQGILDGNLTGDPSIEGARRYYPPLIHILAAAIAYVGHWPPLAFLTRTAPWVNLLIPASFFVMVRRLANAPAAALATTLMVCFNGTLLPPWMTASYSPWPSVPEITQALFFCGVWMIASRARAGRLIDAVWAGSIVGIVFLAHTIPALILAGITAASAASLWGAQARTVRWLGIAGVTAALWAAPFMVPLAMTYHLKILNAAGSFTDPLFDPHRVPVRVLLASLPGIGAVGLLAWNFRSCRTAHSLTRPAAAILSVWIALPLLFIMRHFGCAGGTSSVCTVFQVPVHHWMIYLQSALACVFGYALASVWAEIGYKPGPAVVAGTGIAVLGAALLFMQPMDRQMRARAIDMRSRIDLQLYGWLLARTRPDALFVTDVATDAVHDSAAMAVLAAGRRSVALPFTYSNPYIDWRTRKARADAYLTAIRSGPGPAALCELIDEAGPGHDAFVALEAGSPAPAALPVVIRTRQNSLYSVPSDCRD